MKDKDQKQSDSQRNQDAEDPKSIFFSTELKDLFNPFIVYFVFYFLACNWEVVFILYSSSSLEDQRSTISNLLTKKWDILFIFFISTISTCLSFYLKAFSFFLKKHALQKFKIIEDKVAEVTGKMGHLEKSIKNQEREIANLKAKNTKLDRKVQSQKRQKAIMQTFLELNGIDILDEMAPLKEDEMEEIIPKLHTVHQDQIEYEQYEYERDYGEMQAEEKKAEYQEVADNKKTVEAYEILKSRKKNVTKVKKGDE